MSGHSKWHSIRHQKAAEDAKRGKVFTRHANLITIAARQGGGDPDMNPALRLAIDNAKKENVPNDNIDRAIKRGTGELKDGAEISEEVFEGYGPCGVAIIVEALTDNKMRTLTNIRTIFSKRGYSLGESGSVMYLFDRKGVITINLEGKNPDEVELTAIDSGAQDIEKEDGTLTIYTDPKDLTDVAEKLREAGIEPERVEALLIPKTYTEITSQEDAQKVFDFIDAIEDDMDVSNVHTNADIADEIAEKLS